jgi:hypothetical protein
MKGVTHCLKRMRAQNHSKISAGGCRHPFKTKEEEMQACIGIIVVRCMASLKVGLEIR